MGAARSRRWGLSTCRVGGGKPRKPREKPGQGLNRREEPMTGQGQKQLTQLGPGTVKAESEGEDWEGRRGIGRGGA